MSRKPEKKIAFILLKQAFVFYSLITISVTVFQILYEYSNEKSRTYKDLLGVKASFEESLATAAFELNFDQIVTVNKGILKLPFVKGVRVKGISEDDLDRKGWFVDDKKLDLVEKTESVPGIDPAAEISVWQNRVEKVPYFQLKFPLMYQEPDSTNPPVQVGEAMIYTPIGLVYKAVEENVMVIILNALIKSLALWVIFIIIATRIVVNPINKLIEIITSFKPDQGKAFAEGDPLSQIEKRTDELGVLAGSFKEMAQNIAENLFIIKDLNKNLEIKVIERTNQLSQKNRDILALLDNLNEGVCTIDSELKITGEFSRFLPVLLEDEEIGKKDLDGAVFQKSNLGADAISLAKSTLHSIFSDGKMGWDLNSDNLPKKGELTLKSGKKPVDFSWAPILGSDDQTNRILLCITDISDRERLAKLEMLGVSKAKRMAEILGVGVQPFREFILNSTVLLNECFDLSRINLQVNLTPIFRNLHTIKGNARSYRLNEVVTATHQAELVINSRNSKVVQSVLVEAMEKIREAIHAYEIIYSESLDKIKINPRITRTIDLLEKALAEKESAKVSYQELTVEKILKTYRSASLFDHIANEIESLTEIAKTNGKPEVVVKIEDNGVLFDYGDAVWIRSVFNHLFKNTIAHGIEAADVRKAMNKSAKGQIEILIVRKEAEVEIYYQDDGNGLNIEKLRKKTLNAGSLSDKELAEGIFKPGISTADIVNDIAGQGIGLSAVREILSAHKGTIKTEFSQEARSGDYMPFRFKISLAKVG